MQPSGGWSRPTVWTVPQPLLLCPGSRATAQETRPPAHTPSRYATQRVRGEGAMPKALSRPSTSHQGCSIYLQALASGSWDAPAGLLLFVESGGSPCSYLFNCGEGTQRFCTEHHVRLAGAGRLRRLLLTRLDWDAVGGLPGMIFTLNDANHSGIKVHGPERAAALVQSFSAFMPRHALPDPVDEVIDGAPPIALDESGIEATPLVLQPVGRGDGDAEEEEAEAEAAPSVKRQRGADPESSPRAASAAAASPSASIFGPGLPPGPVMCAAEAPSICWLLRMPAVRGRFDARAAAALGVPNGPLRGALCGGATITTPEGREVRPDEVLRGGSDGERVLVVDCPTIAHLRLLRSHAVLAELRRAGGASGAEAAAPGAAPALAAVAHLTPHSVCALPEYIAWCASLPRGTAQAFLRHTPHPQRLAFVSSARLQLKLHAVHGAVFPLPRQMPPVSQGGLPAGMPPAAAALDMLGKLVIRPSERAGVCREEEKRLRLWSDSSGEVLSLDEAEVRTELTRNARLGRALAALPSELRLGDGSWQSELRRAADLTDALPEPSRNPPGTLPEPEPVAADLPDAAPEAAECAEGGAASEATSRQVVSCSGARIVFLGTGAAIPSK